MSSLRRRAICVQRAMSTERSSIGGRASARTTAGASVGSASSRSHASTSRISARRKNAVSPTSRWGTARSSSATATAWPSRVTLGTSTAIWPGDTPSPAISRSTSAATDWAWARSLAQRQNATSPSTDGRLDTIRDPPPRRPRAAPGAALAGCAPARSRAPRMPPRQARRAVAEAAHRVGGHGQPRSPPPPAPASPTPGRARARRRPARARSAAPRPAARGPPAAHRGSDRRRPEPRPRPASARGLGTPRRTRARPPRPPTPSEPASASRAAQRAYSSAPIRCALSRSIRRTNPASSAWALPPKSWRSSDSRSIRSSSIANRSAGPEHGLERVDARGPAAFSSRRRQLDRREHEQLVVAAPGARARAVPARRRRGRPRRSAAASARGGIPARRATETGPRASASCRCPRRREPAAARARR